MAGPDSRLIVRRRRWRGLRASDDWATSLILAAGMLVILAGLHTILIGVGWYIEFALVGLLVLAGSAVTRLVTPRRWLPPLVSIVVFVVVITAVFAPTTALIGVIPTGDTVAAFQELLRLAGHSIDVQFLPAVADTGISFVACLGVGGIALVSDVAAIVLRSPALAGLPLLVLLAVPVYVDPGSSDPIVFVLAVIVYLLLLRVGGGRGQVRLSLGLGAIVVVLALLLPLALPSIADRTKTPSAGDFGTGINPVLSLGNDLRQSANRTVLTYDSSSGAAQYLRLTTIDDFSGSNWAPDPIVVNRSDGVNDIATAPGLSTAVARKKESTTVNIVSLSSALLPLPYPTTRVSGLSGSWYWSAADHVVSSTDATADGQRYTATDLQLQPTPEQLLAAGTAVPAGFGRFLAVPKGLPAIVSNTARTVVGTASTDYEKALLLQSYFHDGDFRYSETAPVEQGYDGTGGQAIAAFLKAKSGYCIHFASAMAMMARVLGIPARISVGFLPGHSVGGGRYEVDSHDLHAWPELYFEGVGWVRFEPTVSRGAAPAYADLDNPAVPLPSATDSPTAAPTAAPTQAPVATSTPQPSTAAAAPPSGSATTSTASPWWLPAVLLGLVVLAFVPAVIRAAQRSRRLRRLATARAPVLLAWREVLQTSADVGAPIPATLTPREVAAELGGATADDPALVRLLHALERERFAKNPAAYPGAAADTRRVLVFITGAAGARSRVVAALFPPSIWGRVLRLSGRGQDTQG
jgi:transglutaminase-like putative cysteine protease